MSSLIVSIHDVFPRTVLMTCRILEDLRIAGVTKTSLLVIPDHHHRGHFLDDPAFCDWLQEMEKLGHEIVVHGYFHQRETAKKESLRDRVITRFYTAGEGEFYDLSETAAAEKLRLAQSDFAKIGFHPSGFIAPAWLLGPEASAAVVSAGFRYTTTLQEIRHFDKSRTDVSQSLVYSVRSNWRRSCSLLWNRFLLSRLRENPVVRLGIHPPDWNFPRIRTQILHFAKHLARTRQVTTYDQWTQP